MLSMRVCYCSTSQLSSCGTQIAVWGGMNLNMGRGILPPWILWNLQVIVDTFLSCSKVQCKSTAQPTCNGLIMGRRACSTRIKIIQTFDKCTIDVFTRLTITWNIHTSMACLFYYGYIIISCKLRAFVKSDDFKPQQAITQCKPGACVVECIVGHQLGPL